MQDVVESDLAGERRRDPLSLAGHPVHLNIKQEQPQIAVGSFYQSRLVADFVAKVVSKREDRLAPS
jgi:hypothetical protein